MEKLRNHERAENIVKRLHALSGKRIITDEEMIEMYRLRDEYLRLTGTLPRAPEWKKRGIVDG